MKLRNGNYKRKKLVATISTVATSNFFHFINQTYTRGTIYDATIIDVIAVSEDKLLYVTDKFLWEKNPQHSNKKQSKKTPTMRVMFARKPNSSILVNATGSCHYMTLL